MLLAAIFALGDPVFVPARSVFDGGFVVERRNFALTCERNQ